MSLWNSLEQIPTTSRQQYHEIRLILGDQLNIRHSWFNAPENVLFVMFEMRQETDYARHHQQKVTAFFAAMRAFADVVGTMADILYLRLDSPDNHQALDKNLNQVAELLPNLTTFSFQQPDEFRLAAQLDDLAIAQHVRKVSSEHFLVELEELEEYLPADKKPLLESFYRKIRRKTGYLMTGAEPLGEQWNFDQDNRNALPDSETVPTPIKFSNNVEHISQMLETQAVDMIGKLDPEALDWPISRRQSRELLQHFVRHALPKFGQYQDAMSTRGYLLFHSRLSFSLNTKMISPREVIDTAIAEFERNPQQISLAQIEGFVRQIIGWREFVRLIYWREMPTYKNKNYFAAHRSLPQYFWTADTKMHCMQASIQQSLDSSYAHHIQRLMVTGNFALIAGINPDEVDAWYLGIYADAIEWVELPNTRGMSQYADGGLIATKPYASSGNYIHKMSNYCQRCFYNVKLKSGPKSCPFNSLYWNFLNSHRERLAENPRMSLMYRQWDKRPAEEQDAILQQAQTWLAELDKL